MSSDRHERIKQIFVEALGLPSEKRGAYLDGACGGDADVRGEVESLLEHSGGGTLGAATLTPTADESPRFKAGDMFADRYRIVSLLGRGGMGEVYRADDTKLDVTIALKMLRPGSFASTESLLAELKMAREVTHPSVCRVHDAGEVDGESYFTMQFVDGRDLGSLLKQVGHLPLERLHDVAIQLCHGLAAAHDKGIVHRDLKPSNILLDDEGHVFITDFGIAAVRGGAAGPSVGTPGYMAPEQLRGDGTVTEKTDLYALGLVLYQAATGRAPSAQGSVEASSQPTDRAGRILPADVATEVDPELDHVIAELLSPDPADRPASARDVAARLEQCRGKRRASPGPRLVAALVIGGLLFLAASPLVTWIFHVRPEPSTARVPHHPLTAATAVADDRIGIGVLPFENIGPDTGADHLAAGIHAEIVAELAKVSGLRVIARSSTMRLQDDERSFEQITRDLGVAAVVEGTIRRSGDMVRITVELVDTRTLEQLWSEQYTRNLDTDDIFACENEIATTIVAKLGAELTENERERIHHDPDTTMEAHELYLRGTYSVMLTSPQGFEDAVTYLGKSLGADPTYAKAHSRLALVYTIASFEGWMAPQEAHEAAIREARAALDINPMLAEAYVVMCMVNTRYRWNWTAAEAACRRALVLEPSSAQGYRALAQFLVIRNRLDEALMAIERALEIDPLSGLSHLAAARRYYEAGQYDRAADFAREAIELDPDLGVAYRARGVALVAAENYDEGLELLEKHADVRGRTPLTIAILGYAYGRAGRTDEALAVLAELESMVDGTPARPDDLALVQIGLGENDRALELLDEAVEAHSPLMAMLDVDPVFDPLRDDPRFQRLLDKVGFGAATDAVP